MRDQALTSDDQPLGRAGQFQVGDGGAADAAVAVAVRLVDVDRGDIGEQRRDGGEAFAGERAGDGAGGAAGERVGAQQRARRQERRRAKAAAKTLNMEQ